MILHRRVAGLDEHFLRAEQIDSAASVGVCKDPRLFIHFEDHITCTDPGLNFRIRLYSVEAVSAHQLFAANLREPYAFAAHIQTVQLLDQFFFAVAHKIIRALIKKFTIVPNDRDFQRPPEHFEGIQQRMIDFFLGGRSFARDMILQVRRVHGGIQVQNDRIQTAVCGSRIGLNVVVAKLVLILKLLFRILQQHPPVIAVQHRIEGNRQHDAAGQDQQPHLFR